VIDLIDLHHPNVVGIFLPTKRFAGCIELTKLRFALGNISKNGFIAEVGSDMILNRYWAINNQSCNIRIKSSGNTEGRTGNQDRDKRKKYKPIV